MIVSAHAVGLFSVASGRPTTTVGTPLTAGNVASKLGGKTGARWRIGPRVASAPAASKSSEGLGCSIRNSASGVTSRTARGAPLQPGQRESPARRARRFASVSAMRSAVASEGGAAGGGACARIDPAPRMQSAIVSAVLIVYRSEVDRRAVSGGMRRFVNGFGQRRVGVDRLDQLLERALEAEHRARLGDQLRCLVADDVDAENLIVLRLGHDLHESLGVAGDLGAAARHEWELAGS